MIGEEWMQRARCREEDPEMFYLEGKGAQERSKKFRDAVEICRACQVRSECYRYARDNNESHGIWGGHFAWQIQRAKRKAESA